MKHPAAKRNFGHIDIPLQRVHIELTNICEFDCVFCPKERMKRKPGRMDAALAKRLISEVGAESIADKVTFHVMGEPTLHPDLFEILAHAENEGVQVGLTTNGRSLGGEAGRKLLEFGLHQIDVSLQTPDEKSFALRKAKGITFEEYMGGILDFFTAYRKRWPLSRFKFRFLNTTRKPSSLKDSIGDLQVMASSDELRSTFGKWAAIIYDRLGADENSRTEAMKGISRLVWWKWNVIEVYPGVFFETYILSDWGHAFEGGGDIKPAWAGHCFGMRDHFAVLYNGDVTLCCIDFDGATAAGNVKDKTLKGVLSSPEVGKIVDGFKRMKLVHPYCKHCLGSSSLVSWALKPVITVIGLKALKPFFYNQSSVYPPEKTSIK